MLIYNIIEVNLERTYYTFPKIPFYGFKQQIIYPIETVNISEIKMSNI